MKLNYFFLLIIDSKKEYLLLAHVPTALSGGWAVWMLAMNAFVADITAPEDRAFRYGMMHLGWYFKFCNKKDYKRSLKRS